MNSNEIDIHKELKKYFGFDQFKGLQEKVIQSIVSRENTFVIMPTGGGKSLCYQLPALIQKGTAIVVSPLIALMKNQVDAIRSLSSEDGIAHVLNSSLTKTEINQVKKDISSGKTKLLYVAPESLTKDEYVEFLQSVPISFVAIDEAHCISEWGHDFRPEYRNLRSIIKQLGKDIPAIGLTATATPKVQEEGQWPDLSDDPQAAIAFLPCALNEINDTVLDLLTDDPQNSLILCATRTAAAGGIKAINTLCSAALHASNEELLRWNGEFETVQGTGFRVGSPVICLINAWEKKLQNGSLGVLMAVEPPDRNAALGQRLGVIRWDDGQERDLTPICWRIWNWPTPSPSTRRRGASSASPS